ncbi:hypothetical protein ACFL35_19875 [Candidatus Riflebacteria bacterium]
MKIFDSKGNEVGNIEKGKIFFEDTLEGYFEGSELYDNDRFYIGQWTGKESLGKIWDLGFDHFGSMIGSTVPNRCPSSLDPGKFLALNTFSNVVGSAETPLGCAALLLIYYSEKYPVGHRTIEDESPVEKKVASLQADEDEASLNPLVKLHLTNLYESLKSIHLQFKSWLEFYKSWEHFQEIAKNLDRYEEEILKDLENQIEKWKTTPSREKNRVAQTITNEFFYSSNWQNIKKALDQRFIPHFNHPRRLADKVVMDICKYMQDRLDELDVNLLNPFRKKLITFFHMDLAYNFTLNYTRTPLGIIGIPYHLALAPWNWSGLITQLGMEYYHNISGLKTEIKALFFDILDESFIDEINVHWFTWRSKIFADIFAILVMGPAFTMSYQEESLHTMGYLQISYDEKRQRWNQTPLAYACFMIQVESLNYLGFTKEGSDFYNIGANVYEQLDTISIDNAEMSMKEFSKPVKPIIQRLLSHQFRALKGRTLCEIMPFQASLNKEIIELAQAICRGEMKELIKTDMRKTFPAIRVAFEFSQDGNFLRDLLFPKISD